MSLPQAEHAVLAPSSAHRWVMCPGSIALMAQVAQLYPLDKRTQNDDAAQEGEAAHWALAEAMHGRVVEEGQITPKGWILDEDMIDGAELFMSAVPPALRPVAHIEEPLTMAKRIHPLNWGTPDFWAVDVALRVIRLRDYKYGHGLVEVFECWQLVDYAAGILERLGLNGLEEQHWSIEMAIVQPRVWHRDGHIRCWTLPLAHLRGYWNRLQTAAEVSQQEDPPLQVGPHCEHCEARHVCPALHKAASHVAGHFEHGAPLSLPDNALGYELRNLYRLRELLNARITGLEVDAESRYYGGKAVPWFTMESKPGREKWTVDASAVIAIGQGMGLPIAKPLQPITPRQARLAGMPDSLVASMSERGKTALKLTPVNEKAMRRAFTVDGNVNNT